MYIYVYIHIVCARQYAHMRKSEDSFLGVGPLSTLWVLGTELRPSGLASSTFHLLNYHLAGPVTDP